MGRRKRRSYSSTPTEPEKIAAWKDLVIFTALLLGAEFKQAHGGYWIADDGMWSATRFHCAREYLWKKGMSVRMDGSIFQNTNISNLK